MTGAELIAKERQRQVEHEQWSSFHDDGHRKGELAVAAVRYATHDLPVARTLRVAAARAWRWASCDWKPKDRIRNLARAGALIAAEIDRLQRAQAQEGEHG